MAGAIHPSSRPTATDTAPRLLIHQSPVFLPMRVREWKQCAVVAQCCLQVARLPEPDLIRARCSAGGIRFGLQRRTKDSMWQSRCGILNTQREHRPENNSCTDYDRTEQDASKGRRQMLESEASRSNTTRSMRLLFWTALGICDDGPPIMTDEQGLESRGPRGGQGCPCLRPQYRNDHPVLCRWGSIRVDMVHKPGSQPQQAGLQPEDAAFSGIRKSMENDGMLGTFAPEESIQRQRADIDPFNLPHGSPSLRLRIEGIIVRFQGHIQRIEPNWSRANAARPSVAVVLRQWS